MSDQQNEIALFEEYLSTKQFKSKKKKKSVQDFTAASNQNDVYLYTSLLQRVYDKMAMDKLHDVPISIESNSIPKISIGRIMHSSSLTWYNFKEICFVLNANPDDIVRFIEKEHHEMVYRQYYGCENDGQMSDRQRRFLNYYSHLAIRCEMHGSFTQPPTNKCSLLIDGYIHEIQSMIQNIIPIDINKICFDYYFLNEKSSLHLNKTSWLYHKKGLPKLIQKYAKYHGCNECNSIKTQLWKSRRTRLVTLECLKCTASRVVRKPEWQKNIELRDN